MKGGREADNAMGRAVSCICTGCPSYTECMRAGEQQWFCRNGSSEDCMFDRKGCSCPSCPARPDQPAGPAYFCARGPPGAR
jgi:hypothetical protein